MLVLGIAGTAKNTGKTTTTVAIVNHWPESTSLAVTSIGYDGESKDNVTGLPKPRLNLPAGAVVVTAADCIQAGSANIEVLEKTDLSTPLGKLVVGRVSSPGLVVMAGPNNQRALKHFVAMLPKFGVKLLLVDGALGRLAPMAVTQGLIMATGAARTRDLERLGQETAALAEIFGLPPAEGVVQPGLKLGSILVEKQGKEYAANLEGHNYIEFLGVVDVKPLQAMMNNLDDPLPDLIVQDPVRLLLSQDLVATIHCLREYVARGGKVMVRNSLPLKAITINPFYPDYDETNWQYSPGYVNAQDLYNNIAHRVSVPVVDIVRQGDGELIRALGI